ncbi:hypothetical protein PHYBLDRAFT_150620 [Phycomyces blakesleeanus NRRL 1555(-)]|uniref:Uncharacterized protein n=1 Tax=Phycomyces blakesleeanus (strain ATCC 8743b / DSM 1359 / FGSC 10004 / NBRC 33097 / NRRL 1555) TaxID=763407 RepID=A0A162NDF6_PHYB8|nr:hypothetical protein PHYBLDRAFT_150620 [Phycomyces blakesleeanus NRRL 1555(-)]OAD68444.1 hypothetical protein PHYBLDRAFT_150620 [Phycomyces blakesleeanus NRRL 1555(-)]|eukprot:XP_018286484.1 hypothetical protein PHYBLDRAFT_150620 [Phycomyces blakesleeanus NRRL 1555(-)]
MVYDSSFRNIIKGELPSSWQQVSAGQAELKPVFAMTKFIVSIDQAKFLINNKQCSLRDFHKKPGKLLVAANQDINSCRFPDCYSIEVSFEPVYIGVDSFKCKPQRRNC